MASNARQADTAAEVEQVIGEAYVEAREFVDEDTDATRDRYGEIGQRHEILYEQIPIPVIWTHEDPYEDAAELRERVEEDDELLVYAGGSEATYMTAEQNVKGRAVHDYFGHYRFAADFSIHGEFTVWYHTKDFYPPPTRRILFTDIVAQRCAAGYLDDGFASDRFEQRAFPAPDHWIELCERLLHRFDEVDDAVDHELGRVGRCFSRSYRSAARRLGWLFRRYRKGLSSLRYTFQAGG